jgi:hypothetical protein
MHKNGTYKTINFVYPQLCLVAVHPIDVLVQYIQPVAIYTSTFHIVDLLEEELNDVSAPSMPRMWLTLGFMCYIFYSVL